MSENNPDDVERVFGYKDHVPIEHVVPPRTVPTEPDIDISVYDNMWEIKYGDAWVQDAGFGQYCISDKFYLAAANALFAEGKLEREWIVGTAHYAYRRRHGNR